MKYTKRQQLNILKNKELFKDIKKAEKYGEKNYLLPELTETRNGNWEVKEGYNKEG